MFLSAFLLYMKIRNQILEIGKSLGLICFIMSRLIYYALWLRDTFSYSHICIYLLST